MVRGTPPEGVRKDAGGMHVMRILGKTWLDSSSAGRPVRFLLRFSFI